MRDLILLAVFFTLLPLAFKRPWIGVLIFAWVSYMNPHRFTWGIAYAFPFAKVAALVALVCLFFTSDKMKIPWTRETKLLLLLGLYFTMTSYFALNHDAAWGEWQSVAKVLLMTFITMMLINNQSKFRYLLLTVAMSIGFLGVKGGLFGLASGGTHRVYGPQGSFFYDNNDMALALNMTIPFLFCLYREEKNTFLRYALLGMFVFSIIAVIFTYSRGGALALAGVLMLILIRTRHKILAGCIAVIALFFAAPMIPDQWFSRIDTIKTYEEDASAMGRINAWHTAINIAKDRPLTGGGFQAFSPEVFWRYSPNPDNYHDVHSIYFEVIGEHGFVAFGIFVLLMISTLLKTNKIRRHAMYYNIEWGRNYAEMLQIALLAYMIGGTFLGRAYFDLFYAIISFVILLGVFVDQEVKATLEEHEQQAKRETLTYMKPSLVTAVSRGR
ncbi:MAG: hypothetical protein FD174_162 [Geobacteraceae bacterium]|nr:MAG: hypothetical protein FD174_162 [Geobacteraceae bacterium]